MEDIFEMNRIIYGMNMADEDETDFFWWEYDDGSNAAIAIDRKQNSILYKKLFDNREKRKEFQEKIKADTKKKNIEFDKVQLKIRSGLKQFEAFQAGYRWKDEATASYQELQKMLASCGMDQQARHNVLSLFSALLAGYYSRFALTKGQFQEERVHTHAPIVAVNRRDGAYDALTQMALSVIIDSSPEPTKVDELYVVTKPVLPVTLVDKHLEDGAACWFSYSDGHKLDVSFPAQYRDTGVLINTLFFPLKEIFNFQRRNPWATTVLFAVQDRGLLLDPIRLDGRVFSHCNMDWESERVRSFLRPFIAWLAGELKRKNVDAFQTRYLEITKVIASHNRKRGTEKTRGTMKFWLTLQMLALCDLAHFLYDNKVIDQDACNDLISEWLNCLLPGCVPAPEDKRPVTERPVLVMERDSRELVELALRRLLTKENLQRFVYVPYKGKFPVTASGHEIWGYLRDCRDNKNRTQFRALVLPEHRLCELANVHAQVDCDWIAAVRAFKKKSPHYLHPTPAMRLSSERLEPVLILKLDELQFLDEEARSSLAALFSAHPSN